MLFTSRKEWGALPPKNPPGPFPGKPKGIKFHFTGGPVSPAILRDHTRCIAYIRAYQRDHMTNPKKMWNDFAYNYAICPHEVFVGRGLHAKSAANGNVSLNNGHYAVLFLVGTSGVTEPTVDMYENALELVAYIRENGPAGNELKGHRDGYATTCPGGPIYAWIQAGCPKPKKEEELNSPPTIRQGSVSFDVKTARGAFLSRGFYPVAPDLKAWIENMMFDEDLTALTKVFQESRRLEKDGVIGVKTWKELFNV